MYMLLGGSMIRKIDTLRTNLVELQIPVLKKSNIANS